MLKYALFLLSSDILYMPTYGPHLPFYGLRFGSIFSKEDLYTDYIKKSTFSQNPTPIAETSLIYVLSSRVTALGNIADVELRLSP